MGSDQKKKEKSLLCLGKIEAADLYTKEAQKVRSGVRPVAAINILATVSQERHNLPNPAN